MSITKSWLSEILLGPERITAAAQFNSIHVSRRVHVNLLNLDGTISFKKFQIEVEVASTLPSLDALHQLNKRLWKIVKRCIPHHLENNQYIRKRYHVSVFQSERDSQYVRNLDVFYTLLVVQQQHQQQQQQQHQQHQHYREFKHIPDDVIVGRLAHLLPPRALVKLAFSNTRYLYLLLTSSLVVVAALQREQLKCRTVMDHFDAFDAHQSLTVKLQSLTFTSDSEIAALEGALSSWMPTSSSMSPGFIRAFAAVLSIHLLSRDVETFRTESIAPMNPRSIIFLGIVQQGRTSAMIRQLQKFHGGAWLSMVGRSNLWPLAEYFNVLQPMPTSMSNRPGIRLDINTLPKIFHELCQDPTILCVDSKPLQRLGSRFLNVCKASLNVIVQSIPLTISKERNEILMKAERRLLNRYQTYQQGVNTLEEFASRKWPTLDAKVSLPVFAALDTGHMHRLTLSIARSVGLLGYEGT